MTKSQQIHLREISNSDDLDVCMYVCINSS
jgi:hypothetical protein